MSQVSRYWLRLASLLLTPAGYVISRSRAHAHARPVHFHADFVVAANRAAIARPVASVYCACSSPPISSMAFSIDRSFIVFTLQSAGGLARNG